MRKADPVAARLFNGLLRPKKIQILGFELSGVVEAVGRYVTRFNVGDQVFAGCGLEFGAYTEYKCIPEDGEVALKPEHLSYLEAAAVPVGGATALRFLRNMNIQKGQKILIYGATGSVGSYAVQLAKYFGAHVTAVCSTPSVDLVKNLGADVVIDYKKEDFTNRDEKYDYIFDAVAKAEKGRCKKRLKPNGKFVSVHGTVKENKEDIHTLNALLNEHKLKPVIDRSYVFKKIPEAHRYVEAGHKKGNVVIQVV